jgi:hypothetical protein
VTKKRGVGMRVIEDRNRDGEGKSKALVTLVQYFSIAILR